MSNFSIYQSEDFIALFEQYKHENPDALALKLSSSKISYKKELIQQIQGWQKSKEKLPLWHQTSGIIYPPKINLEQCSSEITARYKAQFYKGKSGIDLTGGFGIDSYFFAKQFEQFYYVEPNAELLHIVQHDLKLLGANNIVFINKTAEEFLKSFTEKVDFIFIDPSRRDEHNRKLSAFKNTQPNVIELLEDFKKSSQCLLIKASPMLDIKQGIAELKEVKEVKVISVNNECKELLFEVQFNINHSETTIKAIDLNENTIQEFTFIYAEEESINIEIGDIEKYIYEPSSAIIKSGAFKIIAKYYQIKKLHPSTHLYTSDKLINNFQGRIFIVKKICPYKKEDVLPNIENGKANVSIRNFKDSTDIVKKKLSIKDGGNDYIFACTDKNNKPVIIISNKLK
jgi:16S rRNA G966 N2-methylase RsmD